jgi:excisionase family DNA binding protein
MMTVLLTKKEAADRLRVSVRSLDRLRSQGQLRTVQVRGAVRITESEIERFITQSTAKAVK